MVRVGYFGKGECFLFHYRKCCLTLEQSCTWGMIIHSPVVQAVKGI